MKKGASLGRSREKKSRARTRPLTRAIVFQTCAASMATGQSGGEVLRAFWAKMREAEAERLDPAEVRRQFFETLIAKRQEEERGADDL